MKRFLVVLGMVCCLFDVFAWGAAIVAGSIHGGHANLALNLWIYAGCVGFCGAVAAFTGAFSL